jgi:hypothetical protein
MSEHSLPQDDMTDFVKIGFEIEDSSIGSSIASTETVWAKKVSDNQYEIRNIPFDAYGVSWGDIVSVKSAPDGLLMYDKILEHRGHSTFRFKVFEDKGSVYTTALIKKINNLGCGTETSGVIDNFAAIDVPPEVRPETVGDLLAEEARQEKLDFEEASIPNTYKSRK